jgi:hypothetical protein
MVLFTIFVPLSRSMQVAFAKWALWGKILSIKLLLYWCVPTLQRRISLNIVACIMELTTVVWNACLMTWDTYNWMMVRPMIKITTKI